VSDAPPPGLWDRLRATRLWRSIVREPYADTPVGQVRTVLANLVLHIRPAKVRPDDYRLPVTFCLGGITALLFLVLTVTGVYLMVYFRPTVPQAYHDIEDLMYAVPAGAFLRNLHRWSAHGMVVCVLLHMVRVFLARAYRPPREFNWIVGVGLLLLTLLLSYTGYLLPWDQLALWAVTVGTNMAESVPLVGAPLRTLLLGDDVVGESALLRFYVLHCIALPLATVFLMGVHFWRIRKDGGLARSL
jgi:quinol---cytochrome c reductase cytochrome b subunit, bacillus type